MNKNSGIFNFQKIGAFSPRTWLEESNNQRLSSKMLRDIGRNKKHEFEILTEAIKNGKTPRNNQTVITLITEKEAAYRSSMLLIGYAFELALKSGVIHLYRGIPERILKKDIKITYGHNLKKAAEDIGVAMTDRKCVLLDLLREFVLKDARYPITPREQETYSDAWNINHQNLQDEHLYEEIESFYWQIIEFVKSIDRSSDNPSSIWSIQLDKDGYLVYRIGGNLSPRITVKYSSVQIDNQKNSKICLKQLLENESSKNICFTIALKNWDANDFYEHTKKETLKRITN